MYLYGEGVPQDYAEAVKWYRIAAEQGDAEAQAMLGIMYLNGEGVPQDNVQALNLLLAPKGKTMIMQLTVELLLRKK